MSQFKPDIVVYNSLYAVLYTEKEVYTFELRFAQVHLSLAFNASCTISVINKASKSSDGFIVVDTDKTEAYSAFKTNMPVVVYQTIDINGKEQTKTIFSGFVLAVERAVASSAQSFSADLTVTLVSAAAVYAKNASELVGAVAIDAKTNTPGQPFQAYAARLAIFGKGALDTYKDAVKAANNKGLSSFNLVKFVCDSIEVTLSATRKGDMKKLNVDSWKTSNAPQYSDLRRFIYTEQSRVPLLAVPETHTYGFALTSVDQIVGYLQQGSGVDAVLSACGEYGITFCPRFTQDGLMWWAPVPDLPMLKTPQLQLGPDDVYAYTHNLPATVLGKYLNIAAATDLGLLKPAEGAPNTTAQYIVFSAGYDTKGKLSLKKIEVTGKMQPEQSAAIGAIHIIHTPEWLLKVPLRSKTISNKATDELRIRYATALAKVAYGTGEMFSGTLSVKVDPSLFDEIKNKLSKIVLVDLKSDAVDPGILYGRLVDVNYKITSGPEISAELQLGLDCVRSEEENNTLGIDASELLYSIPEER